MVNSNNSEDSCLINDHYVKDVDFYTIELYVWVPTGIITLVTLILSLLLIYMHLRHYTRPTQQRYIIRILVMVPIYAINSWLSLRFYWLAVFFDVARDCYEAFVIYSLFYLLIEYIGGYELSKNLLEQKPKFRPVTPLCFLRVAPHRGFLRASMRLTLQYVIIRPVMTIVAVVAHAMGNYCPGNFHTRHAFVYVAMVNSVSVTLAMYALIQFYVIFKDDMEKYKPVGKFLAVKFVVFMSFWQGVAVSLLAHFDLLPTQWLEHWTLDNMSSGLQNILICCEMLVAAIWHMYAFSYENYREPIELHTPILRNFADAVNPADVLKESRQSFIPKKKQPHYKPSIDNIWIHIADNDAADNKEINNDDVSVN